MRIILLTISLLLVFWGKSLGCSCNFPTEIPKAYQVTNTILKVKVLDKSIVSFRSTMNQDSLQIYESSNLSAKQKEWLKAEFVIKVVVHVSEVFKGNIDNDTIVVYTTKTGASCGYTRFIVDDEYIIYASPKSYAYHLFYTPSKGRVLEKDGTLWTGICTLTGEFNEKHANELIQAKSDSLHCKDFKNGKFEIIVDNNKIIIERFDSVQWKKTPLGNAKYKVTWKSDCEYVLELAETDIESFKKIIGRKYDIEIVDTKESEYTFKCTVVGIGFVHKSTLKRIE